MVGGWLVGGWVVVSLSLSPSIAKVRVVGWWSPSVSGLSLFPSIVKVRVAGWWPLSQPQVSSCLKNHQFLVAFGGGASKDLNIYGQIYEYLLPNIRILMA